jgi:hypothetical protein
MKSGHLWPTAPSNIYKISLMWDLMSYWMQWLIVYPGTE